MADAVAPSLSIPAGSTPARSNRALSTAPAAPTSLPGGPEGAAASGTPSFGAVLSALNPLQYLPVVGTIYRAATGDDIPEPLRRIGSAVGSFLLGGPVGIAVNLATQVAEKVSGIDLDRSGRALLASVLGSPADPVPSVPVDEPRAPEPLTEADALNARELQRLHAGAPPALATLSPAEFTQVAGARTRAADAHAPADRMASRPPEAASLRNHGVTDGEAARDRAGAVRDHAAAARARAAYDRAAGLVDFAAQGLG